MRQCPSRVQQVRGQVRSGVMSQQGQARQEQNRSVYQYRLARAQEGQSMGIEDCRQDVAGWGLAQGGSLGHPAPGPPN